ncbi:MAG: pur operon repressor [Clostridia bacterium]|nr:pur operon repressor [Clostridia bacterium]
MDRIRRNQRLSAMLQLLSESPNKIFTLSHFCDLFGTAKSTMSEDIDILRDIVQDFDLGEIETMTGAAGGVRYRPTMKKAAAREYITRLAAELSGPERVLPGGFLYNSDILSSPDITRKMGRILATAYYEENPDFVLTMETKGIPVALATAEALGVPLVIARHSSKAYEGSAVNINYVSGSSGQIQTMALARRAVREGGRALIVDDFLKGGGTAEGMVDLMREFNVTVVGMAFVMAADLPDQHRQLEARALMTLSIEKGRGGATAVVKPAEWLLT